MAAAKHNPLRRALLGAAVALPFVGRHCEERSDAAIQSGAGERPKSGLLPPGRAQGRDDAKWARALAAYEAVEAELRAFERRTAGAPWEAQEAVEREMDARLDALGPALRRLMRAPAPDIKALARKIALMVDQDVGSIDGGKACLAALERDARRLARG